MVFEPVGFFLDVMWYAGIFAILAISLNLEYGYTGIPNFGQAFFFGMTAWLAAVLTSILLPQFLNAILGGNVLPAAANAMDTFYTAPDAAKVVAANPALAAVIIVVTIAACVAFGAFLGFLASLPAARLREDFFAITLLALNAAMFYIMATSQLRPIFGQSEGVNGVGALFLLLKSVLGDSPYAMGIAQNLVAWTGALIAFILAERIANSPYGRVMKAVRDDEIAAMSIGKNVAKVRTEVMMLGSALAAFAGALWILGYGPYPVFLYGTMLKLDDVSFVAVTMVVVGGMASNIGALVGAIAIRWLLRVPYLVGPALAANPLLAKIATRLGFVVLGAITILMLMFRPKGLIPEKPVKTPAWSVLEEKEGEKSG